MSAKPLSHLASTTHCASKSGAVPCGAVLHAHSLTSRHQSHCVSHHNGLFSEQRQLQYLRVFLRVGETALCKIIKHPTGDSTLRPLLISFATTTGSTSAYLSAVAICRTIADGAL